MSARFGLRRGSVTGRLRAVLPNVTLPTVSAAPSAAWGFRRLVAGYSGPLFRVVRASDSATLDVSAAASGAPDLAAYDTFAAGTTTKIDMAYDQAGTSHLTQPTDTNRPVFAKVDAYHGHYGATFPGGAHLIIPVGLTGSGQATTTLDVAFAVCGNLGGGYAQLGQVYNDDGSIALILGNGGSSSGYMRVLNKSFLSTNMWAPSEPHALVSVHSAANNVVHMNERTATLGATSAGTWSGGFIGKNSVSYDFNGQFFGRVVYPAALSAGDVQTLKDAAYSMFGIIKNPTAQILMSGNSIVQGRSSTRQIHHFQRQALGRLSQRVELLNAGRNGEQAKYLYNFRTIYGPAQRAGMRNLLYAPEPTNDLDSADSAATCWDSWVKPWIDYCIAGGWTPADILVPTVLARNFGSATTTPAQKETERLAYNQMVRDNAATVGYTVVDHASIPAMADPNGPQYADGTHPASTTFQDGLEVSGNGYGYMAKLFADVVNARLAA